MFERNRTDSAVLNGVPVELTTDTGELLTGRLLLAAGRSPADVLNGPGSFIEFEPWGGEAVLVAKATLRTVRLVRVVRPESLKARLAAADGFDPLSILGLAAGASLEEVKTAWHRLSKTYHPDRYASAELPHEVVDYLSAMARRINAAFAALEAPMKASQRTAALRTAPVFTSRPGG